MLSQHAINKFIDAGVRNQAVDFPDTWYIGLFSTLPSGRGSAGTEISTGAGYTGYARVSRAASLANISGTQGDGTTTASSGTNNYVSNNAVITFSASLAAAWSGLVGVGWFDAASGGNLWLSGPLVNAAGSPITRSFAIGDAVEFAAAAARCYFD
jgi:hypothetical protein